VVSDRLTKRMIDLQKSTFEMMLNTSSNIQEQSGRATQAYFEKMASLPGESIKTMAHWMDSVRKTHNEINSIIRDSYTTWGDIFEKTMRHTEKAARQPLQKARQYGRKEE
jgi:cyclopropane fatty-acyl-phospholipid synthase-like methyltransferase